MQSSESPKRYRGNESESSQSRTSPFSRHPVIPPVPVGNNARASTVTQSQLTMHDFFAKSNAEVLLPPSVLPPLPFQPRDHVISRMLSLQFVDLGLFCYLNSSILCSETTDKEKLRLWNLSRRQDDETGQVYPSLVSSRQNRSFQVQWNDEFDWIAYSFESNVAFCRTCFWGSDNHQEVLLVKGTNFTNWKHALEGFRVHEKTEAHVAAALLMQRIDKTASLSKVEVQSALKKQQDYVLAKAKNMKEKLISVVRPLHLLLIQNVSLRGHRGECVHKNLMETDGSIDYDQETDQEEKNNPGNYSALLIFLQQFDPTLKDAVSAQINFTSPAIQNELIQIIGTMCLDEIVAEVRAAKYFSVGADGSCDVSNIDQYSVTLRFVASNGEIREKCVGFIPAERGDGEYIANLLDKFIRDLGLDWENCVGLACDGGGNMAGKHEGAAAYLRRRYPRAIFFHCGSHKLSLVVEGSCLTSECKDIRDSLAVIDGLSTFFNFSPKRNLHLIAARQAVFEEAQKLRDSGKGTGALSEHRVDAGAFKGFAPTRWGDRIKAVESFCRSHIALARLLRSIECSKPSSEPYWNVDTVHQASAFRRSVSDFKVIFPMVVIRDLMYQLKTVSIHLQGKQVDIANAHEHIQLLLESFKNNRANVQSMHDEWFREAEMMVKAVDGKEAMVGRTTNRSMFGNSNQVATESPSQHWRIKTSVPILDLFINELESRFSADMTNFIAAGLIVS